jgi:2-keto-4-pentenoate hydratase/2-oxohepta-3-ene-1,7-dioic acid hydratase in catechol pathway
VSRAVLALLSTLVATLQGSPWSRAFREMRKDEERGNVEIADLDVALTFARSMEGGRRRLLAVTDYQGSIIDAVDLSALLSQEITDPVTFFAERGYEEIRAAVRGAEATARVRIPASALVIPFDTGGRHIAVGTNYPEHAEESGTVRPFLFPKLVQAGASGDSVAVYGGLLDYEVEIAVVPLEPLRERGPCHLGLVLANDFTDRETLMDVADRRDIESGKGFTTGKSFPGYLPIGNLFVIPRDWPTFVRSLELRLFVNDELRQSSPATKMVWDVDEVLARVLAKKDERWEHRGENVALFEGDVVPARTLVLTGTPHGTVFSGVPAGVIASGLARFLIGGWSKGITASVVDAYVAAAREARAYLQCGDDVLISAQRLGELRSRVVE